MKSEYVPGAAEYMQSQVNSQLPLLLGKLLDDALTRFPQADPEEALAALAGAVVKARASDVSAAIAKHSVAVEAARFGRGGR
ncbi:MAG: hypothetical protein K0S56_1437 [Microvirga sp.]|jgi:hypothetical protein|nr:hypothetical protein [Microvirga sp.]